MHAIDEKCYDPVRKSVKDARDGNWRPIRRVLKTAIDSIDADQPMHPSVAGYVGDKLQTLSKTPRFSRFADPAAELHSGNALSQDAKHAIVELLTDVRSQMIQAGTRAAERIESASKDPRPIEVLRPNRIQRNELILDPEVIDAFSLGSAGRSGGRPRHNKPPAEYFDEYAVLRGYGATKSEAQQILGYRLGLTQRSVQAKLRLGHRVGLETRDGEPVLRRWNITDEDCPPESPFIPFEPYLKSRLTTFVLQLEEQGVSIDEACHQVAKKFKLNVQIDKPGHEELVVDGARIVQNARSECLEHQDGWSGIPLRVAAQELDRPPVIWPTERNLRDLLGFAARRGVAPTTASTVTRTDDPTTPRLAALEAVAGRLDLSYSVILAFCRQHYRLEDRPFPEFRLQKWTGKMPETD